MGKSVRVAPPGGRPSPGRSIRWDGGVEADVRVAESVTAPAGVVIVRYEKREEA